MDKNFKKHLKVEPLICKQNSSRVENERCNFVANCLYHDSLSNVLQPAGIEGEAGLNGVVYSSHHACLLNWRQGGGPPKLLNLKKYNCITIICLKLLKLLKLSNKLNETTRSV